MNVTRLNVSLEQYEVGLSGAVPDRQDWSEPAMDRGILEFVALFSGVVFKYGGRIVHGSHPTFPDHPPSARQHAAIEATGHTRCPTCGATFEEDVQAFSDVAEFVITRKSATAGRRHRDSKRSLGNATGPRDAQNIMVAGAARCTAGGKILRARK